MAALPLRSWARGAWAVAQPLYRLHAQAQLAVQLEEALVAARRCPCSMKCACGRLSGGQAVDQGHQACDQRSNFKSELP